MTDYSLLESQLRALLADEPDALANAANMSALLFHNIADLNWLGFYVRRDAELVLGPFQGNAACVRIGIGHGVCGTAAATQETQRIDDVHAFPGHIACDAASRSELVVPLIRNDEVIGVLDIDSPQHGRFSIADQLGVEQLCKAYLELLGSSDWL